MPLSVTFDTNVLDKVCRPTRHPKDPKQPLMQEIHNALVNRKILGFFSVTMLTIEGIKKEDRAKVFAGTQFVTKYSRTNTAKKIDLPDSIRQRGGSANATIISNEYQVTQPDRGPLHAETIARTHAAMALGLKALKAVPRIGAFRITDKSGQFYLDTGKDAALSAWIDKAYEVAEAIESRGVGIALVEQLGKAMGTSDSEVWYRALVQARDVHERRAVERAFSEWADGDSVASHVAYGLDVFCTNDVGKSGSASSILDAEHRAWLTKTYRVRFMTLDELAARL